MPDFVLKRRMMVDGQLRTYDVTSGEVISAFLAVPRELFVGPELQEVAYIDRELPLPGSDPRQRQRCMMTPMVLSRMIQHSKVQPGDRTLVVGAGTGYSAAILSAMGATVVALESEPSLIANARSALGDARATNIDLVEGPLPDGWPGKAPYDMILIDGAFLVEPSTILAQVAEGGRLVGVKGEGRAARALLYRRSGDVVSARPIFDAAAPVLDAFRPEPAFVF